jgi:hypothetical protein
MSTRLSNPLPLELTSDNKCLRCEEIVDYEDMEPKNETNTYYTLIAQISRAASKGNETRQQELRRRLRRYNKPVKLNGKNVCQTCWEIIQDEEDKLYDSE